MGGVAGADRAYDVRRVALVGHAVGGGKDVALGVADRDRPADELVHRLRELGERPALDGDRGQPGVDRARALELDRLAVEDRPEELGEDVVEHRLRRQADDREPEPVGERDDVVGNRLDVEAELDDEAGELAGGERGDEAGEGVRVVADRVARRQEKLAAAHPADDVGVLHDVDAADAPLGAARPREDRRAAHAVEGERLAHRDRRLQRSRAFGDLVRHDTSDRSRSCQPAGRVPGRSRP
jgi:hypothetical protein